MESHYIQTLLSMAEKAAKEGEVPVAALVVHDGLVIAAATNQVETRHDPTAHAEILVLQQASNQLGNARLTECDIYVTLEPCPMCAQAISFARCRRLYFAAYDPKGGGVDHGPRMYQSSSCHHAPEVYGGIMEREAKQMLQQFFQEKR